MDSWIPVALDDLYPGDEIRLVDTDGLRLEGWFRGIERLQRAILIDMPIDGFDGAAIGATITHQLLIETRDVRSMERRGRECRGK